jgi:hypothetical protein
VAHGVEPDHVGEVRRSHGPAERLHGAIHFDEIRAVEDQLRESQQVSREQAVHQEARAVPDDDRRLAEGQGIADGCRERRIAGASATNHLDQRHHRDRIEEMQPDELLWPRQRRGKVVDAQAGGVGGDDSVVGYGLLHLREHSVLELEVLDDCLDRQLHRREALVVELRRDARAHGLRCLNRQAA